MSSLSYICTFLFSETSQLLKLQMSNKINHVNHLCKEKKKLTLLFFLLKTSQNKDKQCEKKLNEKCNK